MAKKHDVKESVAENGHIEQENQHAKKKIGVSVKELAGTVGEKAGVVAKKSTDTLDKTKEAVFHAVDVNGDGQIDIEDIILMAFRVPGVSVNRENFLRKELMTKYDTETIEKAVLETPMKANIEQDDIEKIAASVIQNERIKVSGISAALGTPGGAAMVATIPADIAQYYGCML